MIKDKRKPKGKNKRLQQESPLAYWWNEFLFRKKFRFETTLSPNASAESIQQIQSHSPGGWWANMWNTRRVEVNSMQVGDEVYHFTVRIQQRSRSGYQTQVEAEGSIFPGEQGGSVIEGAAKMNPYAKLMIILIIVMLMTTFGANAAPDPAVLWVSGMVIVLVLTWVSMYRERNQIIEKIRYMVMREKIKR